MLTEGLEGCHGCCEGEDNALYSPVSKAEGGVIMCGRGIGFAPWQWLALELLQS